MRPIVAALLVSALLSACTKRGAGIGIGVGLGIAAGGGVIASNPGNNPASAMGAGYAGIALAVLGGTVVAASLVGMAIGPVGPMPHRHGHHLFAKAKVAARRGDCATALKIGEQLVTADREIYDTLFVGDVVIKRCFPEATGPDAAPQP